MAIPKWHEFFPAIIKLLSDEQVHHRSEIRKFSVAEANLTEEERTRAYPRSGDNIAEDRAGWAISSLKEAGLVKNVKAGYYQITELGKEIFEKCPENLNYKFLHQYGKFKFFEENYRNGNGMTRSSEDFIRAPENLEDVAIPKWHEFFPTIIKFLSDGLVHHVGEMVDFSAIEYHLTEEEKTSRYKKSGDNILATRMSWAVSSLKAAGLVKNVKWGYYQITDLGKEIFKKCPENLNYKFLHQYGHFKLFEENYRNNINSIKVKENFIENTRSLDNVEDDPSHKIESAIEDLNQSLRNDLLEEIMKISDYDFEHLVTKLLIKMGYGSSDLNKEAVTKRSYDGGIDSVVTADRFGFEFICIQAKKWDLKSTVGRPEIQKFLGALVGKSAKKGLFITTAKFSSDAINFANSQLSAKIVLVDGSALADLMIEYNFGVNIVKTFNIKRLDSDFLMEGL